MIVCFLVDPLLHGNVCHKLLAGKVGSVVPEKGHLMFYFAPFPISSISVITVDFQVACFQTSHHVHF